MELTKITGLIAANENTLCLNGNPAHIYNIEK